MWPRRRPEGGSPPSVAIKHGQATVHVAARVLDGPSTRVAAVYRVLTYGLQRARQMGARQIRIVTDEDEVIAHLEGQAGVAPALTGPYLQVQALLNVFRRTRLQHVGRERNGEAVLAAQAVLGLVIDGEAMGSLPLWM